MPVLRYAMTPLKEVFALALTDLELAAILTIGAFERSTRKPNPVVYSVVL